MPAGDRTVELRLDEAYGHYVLRRVSDWYREFSADAIFAILDRVDKPPFRARPSRRVFYRSRYHPPRRMPHKHYRRLAGLQPLDAGVAEAVVPHDTASDITDDITDQPATVATEFEELVDRRLANIRDLIMDRSTMLSLAEEFLFLKHAIQAMGKAVMLAKKPGATPYAPANSCVLGHLGTGDELPPGSL